MATIRLDATEVSGFPRLAWLVRHEAGGTAVDVRHGPWVEVGPRFAVEGVWPGPFDEADFHVSHGFFGSGVRVEGDRLWLVPSRGPVDRVFYVVLGEALLAANSLPLLLAAVDARLDPEANYRVPTKAPAQGIDSYGDEIPVLHPRVTSLRQRLYDPLGWRDGELRTGPRPPFPGFSSYEEYIERMRRDVAALVRNARSGRRDRPMRICSTLSSGYDSAAVTALVAEHALEGCFSGAAPAHSLLSGVGALLSPDDSGRKVAPHLGVPLEAGGVRRTISPSDEPYFYAAGAATTELALAPMCDRISRGGTPVALFTGYRGDLCWDTDPDDRYRTSDLRTGDCDISEVRLVAGFVNAPVPCLHARATEDLLRISGSQEMAPWRLDNDYDRPIPRRILEEAGVPRGAFGQKKRGVERRERLPRDPGHRREFARRLRERHGWPTAAVGVVAWWNDLLRSLVARLASAAEAIGIDLSAHRIRRALGYVDMEHELHVWAVNHLTRRIRASVGGGDTAGRRGGPRGS